MDLTVAKETALDFMEYFGLIEKGWTFDFNNAKRSYGRTTYGSKKEISLSKINVKKMSYKDVKDTILHEIAHAIDVEERGTSDHSHKWKVVAERIGADPRATHTKIENSKDDYKYILECTCGKWYGIHRKSSYSQYKCSCGKKLKVIQQW